MGRLIDADEFIKFIEETTEDKDWLVNRYNADWICSFIENAPTFDAVEIVRCKDCKWFDRTECCNCKYMNDFVGENDYCSFAERKENAE